MTVFVMQVYLELQILIVSLFVGKIEKSTCDKKDYRLYVNLIGNVLVLIASSYTKICMPYSTFIFFYHYYHYFCLVAGMVSLWSLAVIAFERWLVVCKPLGNFAFRSSHAFACCGMTWVCAMSAAVPPLVGWSR